MQLDVANTRVAVSKALNKDKPLENAQHLLGNIEHTLDTLRIGTKWGLFRGCCRQTYDVSQIGLQFHYVIRYIISTYVSMHYIELYVLHSIMERKTDTVWYLCRMS